MIIPIRTFSGEFPRLPAHQLPDGAAQYTQAIDIARGDLSGLAEDGAASIGPTATTCRGIYLHEGNAYSGTAFSWFAWNRDVDVVRGPVVDDQYNRFYWADGTGFYVSQANIGPFGYEPGASNKWKVGVPKPTTLLSRSNTGFAIPGIASFSFEAFCESSSGEQSHLTALTPSADSNSWTEPTMNSRTWTLPFDSTVCPAGSGTTTTESTSAVDMGGLVLRGGMVVGPSLVSTGGGGDGGSYAQVSSGVTVALYGTSDAFGYAGALYFHWADWEAAPLADTMYGEGDASSTGGYTFHHIGSGWYSTDSGAEAPNDGGASSVQATSPAVKVTMTKDDGSVVTAILRQDSGSNTWPGELFGYTGEMKLFGQIAVTVTIRARDDYAISRAYAYSYVNTWGEESALSDPLELDDVVDGASISLQYAAPAAGHGYRPIDRVRIYRTATGSGGTDYLFVGEEIINAGSPFFLDDRTGDQLGESAQTVDFLPPPQNIKGLAMLPNGILAGFVANEIYLMEPYLPYACVRANIKTLPHNIVSLVAAETGLYAITTSYPYLLSGVTPDAIVPTKISAIQGGVAKRAVCDVGQYLAYASNDGLVMVRGLDASMDASFKFWTREKWQELYGQHLARLHLDVHDGCLLGWFDDGWPGFLVRLDEAQGLTQIAGSGITASFVSPQDDALYLAKGTRIHVFRKGLARREWIWWSKDYILPKPANMGVMQVIGEGVVDFDIAVDGQVIHSIPSSNISPGAGGVHEDGVIFRLPPGFKARRWMVMAHGAAGASVREIYLAGTVEELKRV